MNSARRRLCLAALFAPLLLTACVDDDVTPATTRYDSAVRRVMGQYGIPGALVSVRVPGEPEWKQSYGYADLPTRTPMDLASTFPIRSITKSYTVTLILELVRDKALRLEDTLDQFIPGVPNGNAITVADLAGMQSGVGDYSSNPAFLALFGSDPARPFTEQELVDFGIARSPQFDPGAEYEYSNTNTVLLGMIVEQKTGMTMAQALADRIFKPLGLTGTSYPYVVGLPNPRATPYEVDVHSGAVEALPLINPTALAGAGAMNSTLDDLQTWGQALGDGRLVGAELQLLRVGRSREVTNGPEYDRYGLGIGILKGWWGHTGTGVGFQAATFYDPRTRATIAVSVNATPRGGRRDLNFAQEIFEALADVVATQ